MLGVCRPGDTAHSGLSQITHFTPRHARAMIVACNLPPPFN